MLVQVKTVLFAFLRDSQQADRVDCPHHGHGYGKGREGDGCAADELRFEERHPTAVEEAFQRSTVVGSEWARGAVLTAGEEAERQRSPDTAQSMDRNSADGIVDAQVLEQFNASVYHHASDASEDDGTGGADPIAGAGDRDETGEKAVDREAHIPLLRSEPGREHCGETTCAGCECRVGRDAADANEVHRGECAARVEGVPSEPQQEATGGC